ncbi:MAG: hypothetical protein M1814_003685 [Vezdaea aestivalis]|nr:MAG: hypothetical protein M1814_003685 [Vezdaea aestivalis]
MAGSRTLEPAWTWHMAEEGSRSSTPRASWPPAPPTPAPTEVGTPRRNPWSTSAPHSPPSESRSATPIAPQPYRPVLVAPPVPRTPFTSMAPPSPARSEYAVPLYPARSRDIPAPEDLSSLVLTPSYISDLKLSFPSLLSKQGWDSPTAQLCYIWGLKNPKTALLLYMTNNLENWPIAAIFTPLSDSMMPFNLKKVEPVVGSQMARRVVDMQRRVCISTLISGEHVQVRSWEDLPLQSMDTIQHAQPRLGLSEIDKVRWILDKEERFQVRKIISYNNRSQRSAIESEVQQFRKLKHPGIASITASYVNDSSIGILMSPVASCDLAEYLSFPQSAISTPLLKRWFVDLLSALSYLHSNRVLHRNIRPAKILVNHDQILFASFGVSATDPPALNNHNSRLHTGERYVYAAPETTTSSSSNRTHPASIAFGASDVFSLGCVLAEMTTSIKQQPPANFRTFRASHAGDQSFCANLPKAHTWLDGLRVLQRGTTAETDEDAKALGLVKQMLQGDPAKRPAASWLVGEFGGCWRTMDGEDDDGGPFVGVGGFQRWSGLGADSAIFGHGY